MWSFGLFTYSLFTHTDTLTSGRIFAAFQITQIELTERIVTALDLPICLFSTELSILIFLLLSLLGQYFSSFFFTFQTINWKDIQEWLYIMWVYFEKCIYCVVVANIEAKGSLLK